MGIRGLYSCLKSFAVPICPRAEAPMTIGIDTYALFYKFKEDLPQLFSFVKDLQADKHSAIFVLDGTPPPEKQEELALRKQQRKAAAEQAKALKTFLQEPAALELTEQARGVLESKIHQYENESWVVYKGLRDRFKQEASEQGYKVQSSEGEADADLLRMAREGSVQVVLANDMDYFVGGVERLWMINKDLKVPTEFRYSYISNAMGIRPDAWKDIAILAGYEKSPALRRVPAAQAISLLRFYGSLEHLLQKRKEFLGGNTLEEFLTARTLFT